MKELKPLNQNVILDLSSQKQETLTAGGIIIPDTAKEKPIQAKVTAVGKIEDIQVAVGDTVVFKKYSGTEIEYEGKKYLVIPYADLLAKIVEVEEI
jgi:chaperonin GroES